MRKGLSVILALFFAIYFVSGLNVVSQINVVSQPISVVYNEYIGFPKTSDFNSMSNSQLQNINAMTLENAAGKVEWLQNVDLTLVHENFVVNLDNYIDIGQESNKIVLNNSHFTNLAKLVRIAFYNVSFSSPVIYKNGAICTSCSLVSYESGEYVFTNQLLEQFNVFEIKEQPQAPPVGGGGGGGGSFDQKVNFTVEPEFAQVDFYEGESTPQLFKITNAGNTPIVVGFSFPTLANLIISSPQALSINKNQFTGAEFSFYSLTPGIYPGQIVFVSDKKFNRTVDVLVQVRDKDSQYDLSLNLKRNVLRTYSKLDSKLDIVPAQNNYGSDSVLEYKIADFEGNEYPIHQEDVVVQESETIAKIFTLPKLKPGNYLLYAVLSYGDKESIGVSKFKVLPNNFWFYLLVIIIIGGAAAAAAIYHDTNLFTFRSMMHAGLEALNTGDMKKVKDRYRYMRKYFYLLSQSERKKALEDGLRYYSEVKKKAKK